MHLTLFAHPNSRNPRIEKDMLGDLHVYIAEPPLEGKANMAIISSLAKHFSVKKHQVLLKSGQKSKRKVFELVNYTQE